MKAVSIVPTAYLHLITGKPYHLCLAHVALKDPRYYDFYKEVASRGSYVILDNGAAEGESVDIQTMEDLAIHLGVSEIVLPDFLYDKQKTLEVAAYALDYIKTREMFRGKVMAVAQGKTLRECTLCALHLLTWPVDVIGIPKHLTSLGISARVALYWQLRLFSNEPAKEIHFLGCNKLKEISAMDWQVRSLVRSIDSSIAYLYARDGYRLDMALVEDIQRSRDPIDFSKVDADTDADTDIDVALVSANITQWEVLCSGGLF